MELIRISELNPHPRNEEFFDNISGESWTAFLESIKTSGVIEPVVITPEKIIISGHQRVRACKELGINTVLTDMRSYDDEDKILKDLIETNIRQRGIGNPNPVKLGRCIKELERIYGIRDGSAGKRSIEPNSSAPTQQDLAKMIGISVDTLQNYKTLAEMIPELEELVDTGIVTKTTALAIMKELTTDEQEELIANLDVTKKITKQKVDSYIEKIKELEQKAENPVMQVIDKTDYTTIDSYKKKVKDLEAELSSLKSKEKSLEKLQKLTEAENKSLKKIQDEIRDLTQQKTNISKQLRDVRELARLSAEMQQILEDKLAPVKFMKCMDSIEANNSVKISLQKIIDHVDTWSAEMKGYLNNPDEIIVEYN